MTAYDTVTEALNGLKARGYNRNFNVAFDKIMCSESDACLSPEEFEITEVHRFEGNSNPADEDVVYAVESKDGNMKGVITSAFGLYADTLSDKILQKLKIHL